MNWACVLGIVGFFGLCAFPVVLFIRHERRSRPDYAGFARGLRRIRDQPGGKEALRALRDVKLP